MLSVRFGFSWWSQREWSWGGALESLDRTTIVQCEEYETQNQCACRSAREKRGWGYGFMLRTAQDEAEI